MSEQLEDGSAQVKMGALLWQTALAVIVAPVIWMVVTLIVAFLLSFWNRLMTVVRPEIIDFFAVIVATIVGMVAARAACDKFFKHYSRRPIFVIFVLFGLLSLVGVITEFASASEPEFARPITAVVATIAMVIAAYSKFWLREEAGKQ